MCLAVPAKIIAIGDTTDIFRAGTVDFGGVRREINLAFVPDAQPGDYVLVHVGVAISQLDEAQALRTLEELREMAVELGMDQPDEISE